MDIRVYYEDTDCGGVVYYANYLCFLERARTEFFRDRGIDVAAYGEAGFVFVVVHVDAAYKASARHNDLLQVDSEIVAYRKTGFTFSQRILHKERQELLVEARIRLACVNHAHKPTKVPDKVVEVILSQGPFTGG